MELDSRKQNILTVIVEAYVRTGEPVGSKYIAEALESKVSSATIRNDMAYLTELGLIEQPYTSAGRVPTNMGYREYVNRLMNLKPITEEDKQYIYASLYESAEDPEKLLEKASSILAKITNLAAISKSPQDADATVRYVQFIITGRRSGMIVLMTSSGMIKSRSFRTEYTLTPAIVRIYEGVFNEKFGGVALTSITPAFVRKIALSLGEFCELLQSPLAAFILTCRDALETDVKLKGQTNLLYIPGFEVDDAKRILDFLNHQDNISNLFNSTLESGDVEVFIGGENEQPELNDSTVVIARYKLGSHNDAGAIALVGPTRMDYARSISNLKFLADTVGMLLGDMLLSKDDI